VKIPAAADAEIGHRIRFAACGALGWKGTGIIEDVTPIIDHSGQRVKVYNVQIETLESGPLDGGQGDEVGDYIVLGDGEFMVTSGIKVSLCGDEVEK
jgi:nitric oxide synthase oxygenase domain/subunit